MNRSLAFLLAAAVMAFLVPAQPATAQSVTAPPATTNVVAGDDWATRVFQDPIDMSQYTDIAWWTYANDIPLSDLSSLAYGPCTTIGATTDPASSCFRATTASTGGNFWILETPNPFSADIHRNGTNFPINASVYNMIAVRMRLDSGSNCAVGNGQFTAPMAQHCLTSLLWHRTGLFDGFVATYTNPIITYDGWGIYLIDLSAIGLDPNPALDHHPWAGTIRDLRYNLQNMAGANVEIDWIRLVPNNLAAQTITWSGFPSGNAVDIYLDSDNVAGNGNLGFIVQVNTATSPAVNKTSGTYSFPAGALAPGTYFAEICPAGTAPTNASCKYSAGSFKVNDIPTLTFTSPSPEGGEDFATAVLNNPWDMNALSDIDYFANISGLAIGPLLNAVDEAGNPLGSPNVLQGTGVGDDPFLYPLWFTNNLPGFTGRGLTKKIDANKYHILTVEAGIPNKARDVNAGSVARIIWQVQGDAVNGNPRENVSNDIILNHRAGANVIAKITTDMKTLTLEPGASPSTSGWVGNVESFRFDPDEFPQNTPFYLKRVKLAANERAGTIYTIQWTYSDSFQQSGTPTMTLSYDTDTDPSSGLVPIATVNPTTGSYAWNTTGVPNGTYYIYASYSDGINTNGTYSRWPIVAGPAANSTLTMSPAALHMTTTKSGATLKAWTPSQSVSVTMGGTVGAWTATANQPWVQITNGSGTGVGQFSVLVINPGDVIGSATSLSATITVTETAIGLSTTLPVSLSVVNSASGTAALPFGLVDTPGNGTTGVTGSIAVTGWVLDDVGVAGVKLYRNCLSIDNPASCQNVDGNSEVLIGDATFIGGARPDVEALYPSLPLAYRAGWGYLLLTNMLPHVTLPTNPTGGGQGQVTLYAYAIDAENQRVLLGQRTIVMDNDNGIKPFGAIDTPAQGGVVSGVVTNFGWSLAPGAMIPTDGSTMTVIVDGVAVGNVDYNHCRDGATPPAGPGACHDDIAMLFPSAPNITNGGGAIGLLDVNTTTLTNGVHTIVWAVTDSQGRSDGIGSRFFSVLNGGSSLTATGSAVRTASASSMSSTSDALAAPAQSLGAASDLASRSISSRDVGGRVGYDFDGPLETIDADSTGVRRVRMPELGRIELELGADTTAGYLRANGTLRPLPPGSLLAPGTGEFTWVPGPGYIGSYDLVFLQADTQLPVTVTIEEKRSASANAGMMRGWVDAPSTGDTVAGRFIVAGWALDAAAWQGSGVGAVHVWAQRRDVPASSAVFLGAAQLGGVRSDIGALFGAQFSHAGWGLTTSGLVPGTYDVTAYFWSTRTDRFEDARTVTITVK